MMRPDYEEACRFFALTSAAGEADEVELGGIE